MNGLSDEALSHLRVVAALPALNDDRYRLLHTLGRGGMGTVYRASDERLCREVAIKVAHETTLTADLARRMRTEAHVLASLEHPGIVPVHDVGQLDDGRIYYVMKLVDGVLLQDHLQSVSTMDARLRLMERICEPVAFAHAHGLVHRDLKPGNIMVGQFGEVLVMDWGVAKILADPETPVGEINPPVPYPTVPSTSPGTVMGTPGYMPPEQAAGDAALVDQRADVYALGAILFHLLSGTAPSAGPPLHEQILRRRHLPRRLRAIAAHALAPIPDERYRDAAELGADIARFRAGLPVVAHPEGLLERGARFATRYRAPILLVFAYLVMRVMVALAT